MSKPVGDKAKSVVDRLTDTSQYTGSHKERFDADGKGKGKAGRENLVDYDGSTSSATRDHTIDSTAPAGSREPVVKGALGKEKFNVQVARAISFNLYRNGDKLSDPERYTLKAHVTTWDKFLQEATDKVRIRTGAVRKVYKADGKTRVTTLEGLEDGASYLCTGAEAVDEAHFPTKLKATLA